MASKVEARKVEALAERINAMSIQERLRFAAMLVDAGHIDSAEAIVSTIAAELYVLRGHR